MSDLMISGRYATGATADQRRAQRLESARKRWPELRARDIEQLDGYAHHKPTGELFVGVTAAVFIDGLDSARFPLNEHAVDAWYEEAGEPISCTTPGTRSRPGPSRAA
jgi:hypothetical protein